MKIYRCKRCGMELPDKQHLKVHEGVHKYAKSRITEYGDPELSKEGWDDEAMIEPTSDSKILDVKLFWEINQTHISIVLYKTEYKT
jgi:hypothetical protein